jgi:hypothetical protein
MYYREMENIEYKIGGITYYHRELTWGQDKAILALLNKVSGKFDGKDSLNISAKNAFELLQKHDLLEEFWGIVLWPKKSFRYWAEHGGRLLNPFTWRRGFLRRVNLSDASNTFIREMFEDFFLLNKSLMKKLLSLSDGLSSIAQILQKPEPETAGTKSPSTTKRKKSSAKSTTK